MYPASNRTAHGGITQPMRRQGLDDGTYTLAARNATPSGNRRVVFRFEDGEAVDVDLVDYH